MNWQELICIFIVWNFCGGMVLCIASACGDESGALGSARGWEFVNPLHIYKYNYVNWFGAIMVALFYNLLCPAMSSGYWFYKLCTVGRK